MRLSVIKLIRCCFVLLLSLSASAQGTGDYLPHTCKNPYTQQQEIDLGNKVVQQVYQTMPVLPDSDPVAQYIRQLGARLVSVAPETPGLERPWPFNFHVVASSEINAFALPGGTMFVNLGAIQAAQTEAQLAGVMSHELSHVILRHSTCNLKKQQHRGLLYSLGQVGAAVALGGAGGDLAAAGLGYAKNLDFLHMSRGDEQQADMLGVHILHDAGFDPRGLPQFFEIIIAKYGRGGAQFLSDHPNPGNRTEYLNREIATLSPLPHPIVSTPAFTAAHTTAVKDPTLTEAQMKTGGWRTSGLYASAPGSSAVSSNATPVRDTVPATAGSASSLRVAPLTAAQLGIGRGMARYQGPLFSIERPVNWATTPAGTGDAGEITLAPSGGYGNFGIAYGIVLSVQRQEGQGVTDPDRLRQASDSFASRFAQSHGLTQTGAPSATTVAGQPATTRTFQGSSPVEGGTERDWLVTVARPDGDMDTLLFISPTAQAADLQPVFDRMLSSFRPQ